MPPGQAADSDIGRLKKLLRGLLLRLQRIVNRGGVRQRVLVQAHALQDVQPVDHPLAADAVYFLVGVAEDRLELGHLLGVAGVT